MRLKFFALAAAGAISVLPIMKASAFDSVLPLSDDPMQQCSDYAARAGAGEVGVKKGVKACDQAVARAKGLKDELAAAYVNRSVIHLAFLQYDAALADSDACFDRPALSRKAPGFWTTYLHIGRGAAVDHAALATAVREGRTMATTGPLLLFRIDDQISGSTLPPDGRPHVVEIRAFQAHHNWSLATKDATRGTPTGIARVLSARASFPVLSTMELGTMVQVLCSTDGDQVSGTSGTTAKWLRIVVNGPPAYVSAAYVGVGADLTNPKVIPACS